MTCVRKTSEKALKPNKGMTLLHTDYVSVKRTQDVLVIRFIPSMYALDSPSVTTDTNNGNNLCHGYWSQILVRNEVIRFLDYRDNETLKPL